MSAARAPADPRSITSRDEAHRWTSKTFDRRDFLKLAGLGGVVLVSGCASTASSKAAAWRPPPTTSISSSSRIATGASRGRRQSGCEGTLKKAVAAVNGMARPPDFVMFTGDLTHTTDDPKERRQRMAEFKDIVGDLKVKDVRFMPGEHDASLDNGKAFKEFFGATHYTFDHKGVHFIVVDNVSDPMAADRRRAAGVARARISRRSRRTRASSSSRIGRCSTSIRNGTGRRATARRRSSCCRRTTTSRCSTGTSIRRHHFMTGNIAHHAAKGLMFALPVRRVAARGAFAELVGHERSYKGPRDTAEVEAETCPCTTRSPNFRWLEGAWPCNVVGACCCARSDGPAAWSRSPAGSRSGAGKPRVVPIVARKFTYEPAEITLKVNEPVVFQLTTQDVVMGFSLPDFEVRGDDHSRTDGRGSD